MEYGCGCDWAKVYSEIPRKGEEGSRAQAETPSEGAVKGQRTRGGQAEGVRCWAGGHLGCPAEAPRLLAPANLHTCVMTFSPPGFCPGPVPGVCWCHNMCDSSHESAREAYVKLSFAGVRSGATVYSDRSPICLPAPGVGPGKALSPSNPRAKKPFAAMVTPCQISLPPTLHAVRTVPSDSLLNILGRPGTWGLCLSWEVLWDLSPHSPLPGGAPWRGEGHLGLWCASPLWPGHVAMSVCSGSPIPTPLGGWATGLQVTSCSGGSASGPPAGRG